MGNILSGRAFYSSPDITIPPPEFSIPPPRRASTSRRDDGSSYRPPFSSSPGCISAEGSTVSRRLVFKTKDCAECGICSNEQYEVRHPHISSQQIMMRSGSNEYDCPICQIRHCNNNKETGRLSIVLGSSTLHNIWKERTYKPSTHIDFDIIIGGQIHDVHESFLCQYDKIHNPMDILLACGVNNISSTDTVESIIFAFRSLVESIKNHSLRNKHTFPSRIVISTILYAPKYCDKTLKPLQNKIEKVRRVNAWIEEFNEKETGDQLNLHLYGVQGDPRQDPLVHRYEDWKESEKSRKLHLSSHAKCNVAMELMNLFDNLKKKL